MYVATSVLQSFVAFAPKSVGSTLLQSSTKTCVLSDSSSDLQAIEILSRNLPGNSVVVRLGGDEFAVVFVGEKVHETLAQCLKHLETDPAVLRATQGCVVAVSSGFALAADGDDVRRLQDVYRAADAELYAVKRQHSQVSKSGAATNSGMVPA